MSAQTFGLFDSDGNVITVTTAERLGQAILDHYTLVDSTPGADEPFLTVKREWREAITEPRAGDLTDVPCEVCGRLTFAGQVCCTPPLQTLARRVVDAYNADYRSDDLAEVVAELAKVLG